MSFLLPSKNESSNARRSLLYGCAAALFVLLLVIIDDILDLTSSSEKLGKTAGKDLLADKTTYPKLLGMEESKKRAFDLVDKAKKAIEPWGLNAKYLISLADFITNRDR